MTAHIKMISIAAIKQCPFLIIAVSHYRDDGTCRCDDPTHTEMKAWGYKWKDSRWQ